MRCAISSAEQQRIAGFSGACAFELLLMRMEALQLEPSVVKRIETAVFHDLAEACTNCESKVQ